MISPDTALSQSIPNFSFQPIIDLKSNMVDRYEALSRFDYFQVSDIERKIREIENFGLATEFDKNNILSILNLLEKPEFFFKRKVNINVTGDSFSSYNFLSWLKEVIPSSKNRHLLCFEITETRPITDFYVAQSIIDYLKEMSVEVYLDDAISGYITKNLSFDIKNYAGIKIDGSIVNNWVSNINAYLFTKQIISFSVKNGYNITAEFLDDKNKILIAKELGVQKAQGFAVGQPMPFPESPLSIESRLNDLGLISQA